MTVTYSYMTVKKVNYLYIIFMLGSEMRKM